MENFILEYGILAIGFLLFIDDLGIPLPGSTLIFSSAIIASQTKEISICQILIIALIIPPLGNSILFYFGRHGLRKWLNTHGHKIFLPEKRIKKAELIFAKHGEKTVFFAAMITSVRAVSSVIAGSLKMNPAKFLFYHFGGVFLWATVVVSAGYFLGDHIWEAIRTNSEIIILAISIIIVGKIIWNFSQKTRKKNEKN